MKYKPLNAMQRNVLLEAIKYDPDEDYRGDKGISKADVLESAFGGDVPKIMGLTEKKICLYDIINSKDPKILYSKMQKRQFKGLFGKLKEAGYRGANQTGMKDYSKMNEAEMWGYYWELRRELNIFS